jgi:exosome complex component RRP4
MNKIFLPGERITTDDTYIRGHGTYQAENGLASSVYGRVVTINKLLSVYPLINMRYTPEVGDVVVGRVAGVGSKRWRVEINAKTDCGLHLSAINLPGVAQRRKLESDEMKMRNYFDLNDVLVAEVQKVNKNGGAALHTRSDKYKRLESGVLEVVPAMLAKRYKSHFIENGDVEIIIGANGYIWIGAKSEGRKVYEKISKIVNYIRRCCEEGTSISDEQIIFL